MTTGGSVIMGLGEQLTLNGGERKEDEDDEEEEEACYKILHKISDLTESWEHGNEKRGAIQWGGIS
jgi:hypothetical protein